MSNQINCSGSISLPFSSYLVVDHNISCVTDPRWRFNPIITANISNLALNERKVVIPYPDGKEIPNPCDPSGAPIIVYELELRQLYVSGAINYITAANVILLDQSILDPNVTPPLVTCNTLSPENTLSYASVEGSSYLTDMPLFILNTEPDVTPDYCVHVEITDLSVEFGGYTTAPDLDYIYTIKGKFILTPVAKK